MWLLAACGASAAAAHYLSSVAAVSHPSDGCCRHRNHSVLAEISTKMAQVHRSVIALSQVHRRISSAVLALRSVAVAVSLLSVILACWHFSQPTSTEAVSMVSCLRASRGLSQCQALRCCQIAEARDGIVATVVADAPCTPRCVPHCKSSAQVVHAEATLAALALFHCARVSTVIAFCIKA